MTSRTQFRQQAEATLARAQQLRAEANVTISAAVAEGTAEERWNELSLLQSEVENELFAAQVLSRLALAASDPVEATEAPAEPVVEPEATPEPEVPQDPPAPLGFDIIAVNPLDVLEGLVSVGRLFTPRPVKDTPQA